MNFIRKIFSKRSKNSKKEIHKIVKISTISKITWFSSMVLFFILVFILNKLDPDYQSIFSQISMYFILIIGVISFLLMVFLLVFYYSFIVKKKKSFFNKVFNFILI